MPLSFEIVNFECLNELRNGKDFNINLSDTTPNLVGNIGENVLLKYDARLQITSETEGSETWLINNNIFERTAGSFTDDGVVVGNKFFFVTSYASLRTGGASIEFAGTVTFISDDGQTMRFDVDTGTQTSIGNAADIAVVLDMSDPENINNAALIKFGLLNNDETFNFLSKTTEAQQIYYNSAVSTVESDMISLGRFKDWVSGGIKVSYAFDFDFFPIIVYSFEHRLTLNPWYILDFQENLNNDTIPDFLAGENSLKYAFDAEFRKELTEIGTAKNKVREKLEGVVGWFNENFNGFNNLYQIDYVSYEDADTTDPLDAVSINGRTKITIEISKKDASPITSDFSAGVYLSFLPATEEEYINTETDLLENFIYKREVLANPAVTEGDLTSSISSGVLTLEYIVEYTAQEKLKLSEESTYLLWAQIEDSTTDAGSSDRVALAVDSKNYTDINFVEGFVTFESYNFLVHDEDSGVDAGSPTLTDMSNEDGVLLESRFSIDSTKDVVINNILYQLIAYNPNTGNSFALDSYSLDLSSGVISGGVQQFNINTQRGYKLADGDQFNTVEFVTSNKVGDDQFYNAKLGQKIKWQDWQSNPNVDADFYDANEPNENLNNKSSNYSNINDYKIRLATVINVSGVDDLGRSVSGDVIEYGDDIEVIDYVNSGEIGILEGTIETIDIETGQSLGGAVLYNGKDTLFRATFKDQPGFSYVIHRIEPVDSVGDGIFELSSVRTRPNGNLLKPKEGFDFLDVFVSGSDVVAEGVVDGLLIQEGVNYKLSSRFEDGAPPPVTTEIEFNNATDMQYNDLSTINYNN